MLTQYDEAPYARGIFRNDQAITDWAKRAIEQYDIRTPSSAVAASTLSGGNQQKAIVAREFSRDLSTLILDQPTRGLDVGSIEFIHKQVVAKRDEGPRSCSSRPSWTRSWSCPTGSRSSTGASSSRSWMALGPNARRSGC